MIIPPKLKTGDGVRVVSPASSLSIISKENCAVSDARFAELGLVLSFASHAEETDAAESSSIASRVDDTHAAFRDPAIKMVITTIGGFNSNQLLPYLDYDLIRKNPKIFCGYSDITALGNAIYAKTGLVTYSGPSYSSFGEKQNFEYTMDYFKRCLFSDEPFVVEPTPLWSNDTWYKDQERRNFMPNDGFWVLQEGEAEGTLIGGNLCTLNLLQGTEFMPALDGSVLFLEDDASSNAKLFDRDLESLIQQPGFSGVRGLVIGRFEKGSAMTREVLQRMISGKEKLKKLPVIANVDFGHTEPKFTFPIGGRVKLSVRGTTPTLTIVKH
jgi:muramoyltetrapeptide carboxypeptidase LdcA involved in peptidoglycan recycling